MKILRFENVNDLTCAIENELRDLVIQHNKLRIFVPTGRTPLPLYEKLRKNSEFWGAKLDPIQIDEFVQKDRPFLDVLNRELGRPLGLEISAWNPHFDDNEVENYIREILSKPIHLSLLGLGLNGHVGFHEPSYPSTFIGGRVWVSDETRLRTKKAMTSEVLTFGVGAFLKSKNIFLIVTGREKEKIFKEFQNTPPDKTLPATLLKNHPKLKVFTDL